MKVVIERGRGQLSDLFTGRTNILENRKKAKKEYGWNREKANERL